jgi:hypothetical protein
MTAINNLITVYNKIHAVCPKELDQILQKSTTKTSDLEKIVQNIVFKAPDWQDNVTIKNLEVIQKPKGKWATVKNFFHGVGCALFSWAGVQRHKEKTHLHNALYFIRTQIQQVSPEQLLVLKDKDTKKKILAVKALLDVLTEHVNKKEIMVEKLEVPISWKKSRPVPPPKKPPAAPKTFKAPSKRNVVENLPKKVATQDRAPLDRTPSKLK